MGLKFIKLFGVVFLTYGWGIKTAFAEYIDNSAAAAKCESSEYINQSREFFACDYGWSLDSCRGTVRSLGTFVGGGIG